MHPKSKMKWPKLILTILLFAVMTNFSVLVIQNSKKIQQYKKDSAELNHFKYGLLSVDKWKEQVLKIILHEIDKLTLTRTNEKDLQIQIEKQLEILIDSVYARTKETNRKTIKGKIKQKILDSLVKVDKVKEGIPDYAKAMMAEVNTPKNKKQIKSILKSKIKQYMKKTYSTIPDENKNKIIKNYRSVAEEDAKETLALLIKEKRQLISQLSYIIVSLAILIFLIAAFKMRPVHPLQFVVLILTLLVLLAGGITTPMIDLEATIADFNFVLLGQPIAFKNQVLYFQSKSILDVFWLMITHKDYPMKLVGILLVLFSIIFPFLKMLCSLIYNQNVFKLRKNSLILFFVFKSSKWSMADVVVVASFMAYVGFNGIFKSQLEKLRAGAENIELITTNGTSLQPGFYLFFAYAMLAMFLSKYLNEDQATSEQTNQ